MSAKTSCTPEQDTYSFQLLVLPGYNVSTLTVQPPKTVNAGGIVTLIGLTLRSSSDEGVSHQYVLATEPRLLKTFDSSCAAHACTAVLHGSLNVRCVLAEGCCRNHRCEHGHAKFGGLDDCLHTG